MKLTLHRLPDSYTVHRLPPDTPLPAGLEGERFYAILKSADELSLCCSAGFAVASEAQEPGWACLAVVGPLDFALTGIVSRLTAPLAEAGISVFVISSFDTDYLLVKRDALEATERTLSAAGCEVASSPADQDA